MVRKPRGAGIAGYPLLLLVVALLCSSQYPKVEGVESVPEDVTGVDCAMCHGDLAQTSKFPHAPAFKGECTSCHQTTGVGTHGGLTSTTRELCLPCHVEQKDHYPIVSCWASACHSDIHGSEVNRELVPSLEEEYPGFFEATAGARYVGSDTCLRCHADHYGNWAKSAHSLTDEGTRDRSPALQGCESCHGPGGEHWGRPAGIGRFSDLSQAEADTVCLKCHQDDNYVPDYEHTIHSRSGMGCLSCHDPHQQANKHDLKASPNELCLGCHKGTRVELAKFSHHPVDQSDPRTGMLCTDCHNPHGGEGRAMLAVQRDEVCAKCHVDKAGPFVYSHPGYEPAMGQGCMTCHETHGSNNPNLLKLNGRGVCYTCHNDRITHFPAQTCWTTGCHSNHHGSNTNFFFFEP